VIKKKKKKQKPKVEAIKEEREDRFSDVQNFLT
jgi:hypothetical protein